MPVDQSFAGRSYPPTEAYRVGREKIREFAEAIGDPNPAYRDPEAARALGHRDVVAPPTFAITLTLAAAQQVIDDPDLGLDYSRVVHSDQRFRHLRPVVAGDRLTVAVTVENVKTMGGNDVLETRCDVTTEDGEAVLSSWTTLVSRGAS